MAIISKPISEVQPPNSLASETEGAVAVPNSLSAETEGAVGVPNSLASETEGVVGLPNSLASETEGAVSAPNALSSQSEAQVGLPNDLSAESEGVVAAPNALSSESEGVVGLPNSLSSESVVDPSIPNNLTSQSAAAVTRALRPLVDMDFINQCYTQCGEPVTFEDLFTYSRNSSATFINRRAGCNGGFEYFLDTDFVGSVENLAIFAEQFDNAAWTKANTGFITDDGEDENGDKIADKIFPSTTGTLRGVNQAITLTTANHDISFKVKADGFDWVRILDGAGVNSAWFNVKAGVIGTVSGGASAKIEPIGNDFYRCSIADAGAVSGTADIILADADNSTTATANGTDGILLIGSQATLGLKPLPYVKTISIPVTEVFTESLRFEFDPISGAVIGAWIEGDSENLFIRSEEFDNATWGKLGSSITVNASEAPDETLSMDKLVEDSSTGSHRIRDSGVTKAASALTYTYSIFVRASERSRCKIFLHDSGGTTNSVNAVFNIATNTVDSAIQSGGDFTAISANIKSVGNGVSLITMTFTTNTDTTIRSDFRLDDGSSDSYTGDGSSGLFLWGAQLEQLSVVSTYIRTEGSTVSRTADNLSIPVAGNEVSQMSDATYFASIKNTSVVDGGSGSNRNIFQSADLQGDSSLRIRSTGILEALHGDNTPDIKANPVDFSFDVASIFTASDNLITGFYNGLQTVTQDAGSTAFIPDLSGIIGIGSSSSSTLHLFGHVSKMSIYDVALTAQEVALL